MGNICSFSSLFEKTIMSDNLFGKRKKSSKKKCCGITPMPPFYGANSLIISPLILDNSISTSTHVIMDGSWNGCGNGI